MSQIFIVLATFKSFIFLIFQNTIIKYLCYINEEKYFSEIYFAKYFYLSEIIK